MVRLKFLVPIGILLLVAAGGFYYWQNSVHTDKAHEDALNKNESKGIPGYNSPSGEAMTNYSGDTKKTTKPVQGSSNVDTIVSDLNSDANSDQNLGTLSDNEASTAVNDQSNFNFNYESQF